MIACIPKIAPKIAMWISQTFDSVIMHLAC
jgi:hypothetical protein